MVSKEKARIAGQGMKKDTVTTLLFKTNNQNFAEVFNHTVLAKAPIAPEDLEEEDIKETAYLQIAKEGGGTTMVQYRDVVKGIKERIKRRKEESTPLLAILGIENQDDINYEMPFRILEIDFVNYARQIRNIEERHQMEWKDETGRRHIPKNVTTGEYMSRFLKTDRLWPCITLVVYWGEKPWDGPKKLSDLFVDCPWTPLAWDLELNLLDVQRMSEEEICAYTGELRTVFGFIRYAKEKEKLEKFIEHNSEYFNNISETTLTALDELTHSPELQKLREPQYQTQKGGFNMCLGLQEMIREGQQKGMEKGIEEGRKKGIEEGRKEGRKEGLHQGIEGAVELLQETGLEDRLIIEKIMAKYQLSLADAESYLMDTP